VERDWNGKEKEGGGREGKGRDMRVKSIPPLLFHPLRTLDGDGV
jgi:hypothetical protein